MTKFKEFFADFAAEIASVDEGSELVMLRGYLAESTTKDAVRLFMDPSLSSFVDLAEADIKHVALDPKSKLKAVFVWVDKDVRFDMPEHRIVKDEVNPFQGKRVQRQLNQASRIATGFTVATLGCNATTPTAAKHGLVHTLNCNATTPAHAGGKTFFHTQQCNATTPNGVFGDPRLMTLLCAGTTPVGFALGDRMVFRTSPCKATGTHFEK